MDEPRPGRRNFTTAFVSESDNDDETSSSDSDDDGMGDGDDGKDGSEGQIWAQCDTCAKWRRLKDVTDAKRLPKKWFCHMNSDPNHNTCEAPEEEDDKDPDQRLRKHFGRWVRRLQQSEKAEARLPTFQSTRGKKRPLSEQEWIQCCAPNCGKWRALHRSMEARTILEKHPVWFCVMNTWDEAMASCSAPQEFPLDYLS